MGNFLTCQVTFNILTKTLFHVVSLKEILHAVKAILYVTRTEDFSHYTGVSIMILCCVQI